MTDRDHGSDDLSLPKGKPILWKKRKGYSKPRRALLFFFLLMLLLTHATLFLLATVQKIISEIISPDLTFSRETRDALIDAASNSL